MSCLGNNSIKSFFDLELKIMSRESEIELKVKELESCENYINHNSQVFRNFFKNKDNLQKIVEFVTSNLTVMQNAINKIGKEDNSHDMKSADKIIKNLLNNFTDLNFNIINHNFSIILENKNTYHNLLNELEDLISKLLNICQNSINIFTEAKKMISKRQDIKSKYNRQYEITMNLLNKRQDNFLMGKEEDEDDTYFEESFSILDKIGEEVLNQNNLVLEYFTKINQSFYSNLGPLISKIIQKERVLYEITNTLIEKYEEQIKILIKNKTEKKFISNKRKREDDILEWGNNKKFDYEDDEDLIKSMSTAMTKNITPNMQGEINIEENEDFFNQGNEKNFCKNDLKNNLLNNTELKNIKNNDTTIETNINSFNKLSNLKNLKIQIPKLNPLIPIVPILSQKSNKEDKFENNFNFNNYNKFNNISNPNTDNNKNHNYTKFHKVIDETVKDTKDFVEFLKEVNKKDLSLQDEKRMGGYLNKTISDLQKKVSSDVQNFQK